MFVVSAAPAAQPLGAADDPSYPRAETSANVSSAEPMMAPGPVVVADCDHARALLEGRSLCLQRRPGKLFQLAGNRRSEIHATLKNPELIAANKNRVAVIDAARLLVFDQHGRQLNFGIDGLLVRPQAIAFVGRFIMVLDRSERRFRLYDLDGAPISANPESLHALQLNKPFAVAGDAQGNLYIADNARDEILVFNLETGRSLLLPLLDEGKSVKVLDLAADENDRLYVLLRGKDRKYAIWVLRGPELHYRFPLPAIDKPSDLQAIKGRVGQLSVFDARQHRLHHFTFKAVPDRVIALRVRGFERRAVVRWQPLPDHDIRSYALYASETDEGLLQRLGTYPETTVDLPFDRSRFRRFAVRAISTSGVEGPTSVIVSNDFEPAFQAYQRGDYAAAMKRLADALSADPANGSLLKYFGLSHMQAGRLHDAAQIFRQWQLAEKDSQEASFYVALTWYRQHQWTRAEALVDRLLKTMQPGKELLSLCADLYQAMSQPARAETCLRKQLSIDKNDDLARLDLARLQARSRQRKQAVADVAQVENIAKKNRNALLLVAVGQAYEEMGQSGKAIASFDRALSFEPKLKEALVAKAATFSSQKKFAELRSVALKMIQDTETQAEGYRLMADALTAQQRPDEAIISYRKSVALMSTLESAWIGMAKAYRQLNNDAQLEATLEQGLQQLPNSFELWLMRARYESANNRHQKAITSLRRASRLRPESSAVLSLMTKTYTELEQFDAASHFGRQALQQSPDNLSLIELLAGVSRQQGNYPQAIAYYRKALNLKKNSARYTYLLGASYFDAGNFARARHHLERARMLNPKHDLSRRLLAHTYQELKMYSAAIKLLEPLVKSKPKVEDKLYLKQLVSERSVYQKHVIGVESIESLPVHTAYTGAGIELPIVRVTLKNRGKQAVEGIAIRLYMDELLGQPVTADTPRLAAGSEVTVELRAPATAIRNRQEQDRVMLAEIQVSYPARSGAIDVNRSRTVRVRGTRTINWNDMASLSSLVSTAQECNVDPERIARGSNVMARRHVPDLLLRLSMLSATLNAYGVRLQETEAKSADSFVGVHKASLMLQSGEATLDDLRAFVFACLSKTGFTVRPLPGSRTLLLVNSGLPWDRRSELASNDRMLTRIGDQAWITVDSGMLINSADAAWAKPASTDTGDQSEAAYGRLPDMAIENATGIDKERLAVVDEQFWQWLFARQLIHVLAKQGEADTGETTGIASNRVQTAARFAKAGFRDLAIEQYQQLIRINRYHATAYERLAEIYSSVEQYEQAADYYRAAARSNLFETNVLKKESEALQHLRPEDSRKIVQRNMIGSTLVVR